MTTATRHIETDALAGLREELMRAAGRRAGRRRPARRAIIVVAIIVGLLAASAGAAELTGFTTGVPAVDELLDREAPSQDPTPGGVPRLDLRPGPGPASEPLSVPEGDHTVATVAYLTRDGNICTASADRHRGGVRGSYGGCSGTVDYVTRRVKRQGGVWAGSALGLEQRTNTFLLDGDLESVQVRGQGDWTVRMTPPWTPQAPDARPFRLVVVIDDADIGNPDDGGQPGELPPETYTQPTLELSYPDGHQTVLEGRGPQAK
jgi:hypothetical protein